MFAYRSLKFLPTPYQAEDGSRMTLAYFCLSSMSLIPRKAVSSNLNGTDGTNNEQQQSSIDVLLKSKQTRGYIDWVYEQQLPTGGFRGSDSPVDQDQQSLTDTTATPLVPANLIQSYAALLILGMLDDDFVQLNKAGLLRFVGSCQMTDGSFKQYPDCAEPGDPRSTYSAFTIASILDDWSTVDAEKALTFLKACQRPEGGFAIRPFAEPQGGFTYCAIASYALSGNLDRLPNKDNHLRWLVDRQLVPPPLDSDSDPDLEDDASQQVSHEKDDVVVHVETRAGFQGRPGKTTDACYSFWCVAATKLLTGSTELVDVAKDRRWLLSCQHETYGGIAREAGAIPDVYHTYLSLAALSIGYHAETQSETGRKEQPLLELDPAWNVSNVVAERIRTRLHKSQTKADSTL
ncbi:hypothetical protein ACM66B_003824 [Microbotryomycetes sp. NB124-2]